MNWRLILCLLGSLCVCGQLAAQENWAQWRGPAFNGSTTEKGLPVTWSRTNGLKWSAPLPGSAASTPIAWGNSVFLTSPDAEKNLLLIRIDADSGREVWRRVVASGDRDKGRNNMSSPSPVTDGKLVIAMFATGDVAAFDYEGNKLWSRNLAAEHGRFSYMWIYGASPLLLEGRLFIPVLQRNPVPSDYSHAQDKQPGRESFLLCLDPRSGKDLWRQLRVTAAEGESMESYTTPIPRVVSGRTEILLFGANQLTAHDPASGVELWRSPDLNPEKLPWWRVVPSPVAVQDVVVVCAPRREPVFGIQPAGKGLLPPESVLWSYKAEPSDCCSPLVVDNRLYILNGDKQVLTRLDPQTGKVLWQGHLGVRETFRASPLGSDGKIYCVSEPGTVVVVADGDEFKILGTASMGESPVRSSMLAARGRLFVRTSRYLHCIPGK